MIISQCMCEQLVVLLNFDTDVMYIIRVIERTFTMKSVPKVSRGGIALGCCIRIDQRSVEPLCHSSGLKPEL